MAIEDLTGIKQDMAALKRANEIVEEAYQEISDELHDDLDTILIKLKSRIALDLVKKLTEYKIENK